VNKTVQREHKQSCREGIGLKGGHWAEGRALGIGFDRNGKRFGSSCSSGRREFCGLCISHAMHRLLDLLLPHPPAKAQPGATHGGCVEEEPSSIQTLSLASGHGDLAT
jgi:hypothetical protein